MLCWRKVSARTDILQQSTGTFIIGSKLTRLAGKDGKPVKPIRGKRTPRARARTVKVRARLERAKVRMARTMHLPAAVSHVEARASKETALRSLQEVNQQKLRPLRNQQLRLWRSPIGNL
jgi:hypothetical protein